VRKARVPRATTLETLGLGVDPVHKKLIPIEAPMAGATPAGLSPAESVVYGFLRRISS